MKTIEDICICGGGNLGTVVAGVALSKGYKVNLLTGHPDKWNKEITVTDLDNIKYHGSISSITSDASKVIPTSELVLLCLPGYMIPHTLETIRPLLREETIVGSIVSSTGFFFEAHKILPSSIGLFGFQRVPFISRIEKYGESASLLGYKKSLFVAMENCDPNYVKNILEDIFSTPVYILDSYYEAALTNSNPLLHTSRLYTMWRDWNGKPFESQSYFYYDWNDEASDMLLAMDEEFMQLLKALGVKEGTIPPILEYYECMDAEGLTLKIKSIPAFQSIKSPMNSVEDGWIPDFNSRYFTEDFPYGLRFIKELADKEQVSTPVINEVYEWGMHRVMEMKS